MMVDQDVHRDQLRTVNSSINQRAAPSPKSEEELTQLLKEGIKSGVAERSWDEMMADLREQMEERREAKET